MHIPSLNLRRVQKAIFVFFVSAILFGSILFQFQPTGATNQIIFFTDIELSTLGPISDATAGNEIVYPDESNDEIKQEDVRVRGLANGNLLVGWDVDLDDGPLLVKIFNSAGISVTDNINVYDSGGNANDVTFTPTSDGGFYALWFKEDRIVARKFNSVGVSAGASSAIISDTVTFLDSQEPEMVELTNGNFMLTWRKSNAGGDREIASRLFDPSLSPLSTVITISESALSNFPKSAIAPVNGGGAIATWETNDQGDGEVFLQVLDATGAKVGANIQVNQNAVGAQTHPQIAPLANGNVIVVYDSDDIDGNGRGIAGRVFSGTGAPITEEFVVNAVNTSDWQLRPDVVGLKDGSFVVSWESFGNEEGVGGSEAAVLAVQIDQTGTAISDEFVVNQSIAEKQDYAFIASVDGNTPVVVWDGTETVDAGALGIDTSNHTDAFMRFLYREPITMTQYSIGVTDTLTNGQVTLIGSDEVLTVTVQISANYDQGFDLLNAVVTGTIVSDFDASSGTLTLKGSNVTADYAAVIKAISFQTNSSANPAPPRTVTWSIFDRTGLLDTADIEIVINAAETTATPTTDPTETPNPDETVTPTTQATVTASATPPPNSTSTPTSVPSATLTPSGTTEPITTFIFLPLVVR